MFQNHLSRPSSFKGSLKALEADIQHANTLADAVQRAYGGACLQMKLSYSPLAPIFLFLLQWADCVPTYILPSNLGLIQILVYKVYADGNSKISTQERRASLREFYAIIYPSLQQLESNLLEKEKSYDRGRSKEIVGRKKGEECRKVSDKDLERDDECGICMEICIKMVLPSCNHAMCINCYHDWNKRSQSCPFCRASLKRVRSRDLWVLTSNGDMIDSATLEKENSLHLRRCFLKWRCFVILGRREPAFAIGTAASPTRLVYFFLLLLPLLKGPVDLDSKSSVLLFGQCFFHIKL